MCVRVCVSGNGSLETTVAANVREEEKGTGENERQTKKQNEMRSEKQAMEERLPFFALFKYIVTHCRCVCKLL